MRKFKPKDCSVCGKVFAPTSPKHKTCSEECSVELRRSTDRVRDRASRKVVKRECPFCSVSFETTDSKKKYCGSTKCEERRLKKKAAKAERARLGARGEYKNKYYREVLHPGREVVDEELRRKRGLETFLDALSCEDYVLVSSAYVNNNTKMRVVCPVGHLWESSLHNFKDNKSRCLHCAAVLTDSAPERELADYVSSIVDVEVLRNDRTLIAPLELDIFVPDKKVAIEYCGLYWHSEVASGKPRRYHYDKMMKCSEQGVRLITVFEDEYLARPHVVKSRVANALGVAERRVYARKCLFGAVQHQQAKLFLDDNHLQGASGFKYAFGLFYESELVMLMTFGPLSRTHALVDGKPTLELKRFASLPGWSVPGGASKLLKNSLKLLIRHNEYRYLKSYCDMRYANIAGPVYESLGFEKVSRTTHTPHYVKAGKRHRNQGLRKTPEERLTGKTEWELRQEQGYDRIWDCGHATYVLDLGEEF